MPRQRARIRANSRVQRARTGQRVTRIGQLVYASSASATASAPAAGSASSLVGRVACIISLVGRMPPPPLVNQRHTYTYAYASIAREACGCIMSLLGRMPHASTSESAAARAP